MRGKFAWSFLAIILLIVPCFAYESLQQAYNNAGPLGEYDKCVELDPEVEYSGDLSIYGDQDVCIQGNGALIHGRNYGISIGVWGSRLDVFNCVIVGGSYGIYYGTGAKGETRSNTIADCAECGIAAIYPNFQAGLEVWDNIITDCYYGLYCIEGYHPSYIGYNTVFSTSSYRYAEFCPD